MKRPSRILITGACVIAALLLAIVVAVLIVVQTSWFQNYVREKIVSLTEESTGGKVELGSFSFDWRTERVMMKNFVIHGVEPAGSAPLLKIESVVLQLEFFPSFNHAVNLKYLGVTRPSVDVIVFADGKTNLPQPKVVKKSSGKSGLQTVVDLAVKKFELTQGVIQFAQRSIPLNARGENLVAELAYNAASPSYQGKLTMDPIEIVSGQRAPIHAHLELPVRFEGDAVQLSNGKFTAGSSTITLTASMNHLAAPVVNAQLNAHLSLADVQVMTGAAIFPNAKGAPTSAEANIAADMDDQRIDIKTARVSLGDTHVSASGLLRGANPAAAGQFTGSVDLDQVGKLLNVSAAPQGTVQLAGKASLPRTSGYFVSGIINGINITARSGTSTLGPVNLRTDFNVDPKTAALTNLLVRAFGGELTGRADLAQMQYLKFQGHLSGFQVATLARTVQPKPLTYDGTISGTVNANVDLKSKGTSGVNGQTQLTITPGNRGTPISGRLFAKLSGADDIVALDNSYLAFPHSRLDLSGELGSQVNIKFLSRDLNDLLPALNFASTQPAQPLPVTLRAGGSAALTATISGPLKTPRITGHVAVTRFAASGRDFDQLAANVNASPAGAHIDGGVLQRGTLHAGFAGGIGLHDWSTTPGSPLSLNADIQNGDLADVLALAGSKQPVTGKLSANAQVAGTLGNPSGGATLSIGKGSAYGEPFDRADAKLTFADQLVTLSPLEIAAGSATLSASGTFTHSRDSLASGHLQMQVSTSGVSLAQFKTLQSKRPGFAGTVQLNARATGDLATPPGGSSQFALRSVDANLSAKDIREGRQRYGDLTATAKTAGSDVSYLVNSDLAGSATTAHGVTRLTAGYPSTIDASIKSLQIEKVLQLAGRPDLPVRGNLSAGAHLNGTVSDPHANLAVDFTNGSIYDEPIDNVNGKVTYSAQNVDIPSFRMDMPAGSIALSGALSHPANDFNHGHLVLRLNSDGLELAKIRNLQKMRPGLAGALKLGTDVDANLDLQNKDNVIAFSKLDANVNADALRYNDQDFGKLDLTARTQGNGIALAIDSNLAKSSIHGQGLVRLAKGYPVNAKLSFANIDYVNLAPLFASLQTTSPRPSFDGHLAGQITVDGPLTDIDQLRASVSLSQLQLSSAFSRASDGPGGPVILLQNQQPIVIDLSHSLVTVRSAHLTGRSTDISASGTASLKNNRPLDLNVNAATNLGLLQQLDSDIYSGGAISVNATIRGDIAQPVLNGKVELKNASVNMTSIPNGLSNANGVILLNGTNATIQNLTAESGGGKIALGGFAGLTGRTLRFALRAKATKVRTRYAGASIVSDAAITLNGTTDRSLLSGSITVDRIAFNGQNDIGSLLSSTATPPETPSAPSGLLSAMRLDVRVLTSPALSVQTSVTQNLQAEADLTVRGTVLNPGIVGRMTITSGEFVFFGNQYTVNRGIISFFNPEKIQPILDFNLQTSVKGVDVTLGVTGAVDNMKLSYRSDPPLRFDEIVGLLATGKVPSSDPTIAANQPPTPDQSFTQMGESAIVSQAVAAPLASRIQRVFGVNQLKIDPTFVSGSSLPQARVTLQQQISPTIVFTYTTDLTQTTSQIIRLEWAFTPRFSAVATRDEYGIVSLDFFVKRQFR